MPRSLKKGPFVQGKLYKKIESLKGKEYSGVIKTYSRSSTILPEMVGMTIQVHNGNKFIPVKVNDNLVGHKLGEFSPTRLFRTHGGDKKIR